VWSTNEIAGRNELMVIRNLRKKASRKKKTPMRTSKKKTSSRSSKRRKSSGTTQTPRTYPNDESLVPAHRRLFLTFKSTTLLTFCLEQAY
jgi:hypothetical protein